MREFETGATRDVDDGKLDYEGFLSPIVLRRYAEYMHRHRVQTNGQLRDSDNWQKGIPVSAYMKSMWRHFIDVWTLYRLKGSVFEIEEALCAMLFNVQGMLHELSKPFVEGDTVVPGGQEYQTIKHRGDSAPNLQGGYQVGGLLAVHPPGWVPVQSTPHMFKQRLNGEF